MDMDETLDETLDEEKHEFEPGDSILIPLDGSSSRERALHAAEQIAHASGARLVLFRAVPPLTWVEHVAPGPMSPQGYQQLLDDEERAARDYLEDLASPLRQRGLDVRTHVECGPPAPHLLSAVEQIRPRLVVLAAVDQIASDASQLPDEIGRAPDPLGALATQVVTLGGVPVLVVPPTEHRSQAGAPIGVLSREPNEG